MQAQATLLAGLEQSAGEAAAFLKLLANEHRLLILCHLVANGELTVSALADELHLSQSALSQHLARLRGDGLVAFRRESQTLFYRVADPRAVTVLRTLKQAFCD